MQSSIVPHQPDSGNIQSFAFGDAPIRIIDHNGEPWFVAADVCKVLGIENNRNAIARLDADEKDDVRLPDTIGRMQSTVIISEPGLYELVIRSDKPEAKKFRKWITSDVLPAIRKTGGYQSRELSPLEALKHQVAIMEAQQSKLVEHDRRLAVVEARQEAADLQSEFFTVMAYCRLHNMTITLTDAAAIGKRCTAMSNALSIPMGKVTDPRFGLINSYHRSVLEEIVNHNKTGEK